MRILIAPDSFKDSLSANQVALNIETGLKKCDPHVDTRLIPIADGGEGTVEALVNATGGEIIKVKAHDPLMREIDSFFGISGDKKTAVIEMAAASGLELLNTEERNPWVTTTFGTGELIHAALERKCKRIIVGIGGSATNDGGAGMAMALGVVFTDKRGKRTGFGGGVLDEINNIDMRGVHPGLADTEILIACDVNNPLTGVNGASYVYGQQKGADEEMIKKLDRNMKHYAKIISQDMNIDVSGIPGAGAAGGLGAGLMAFCSARLMQGFELIKEVTGLEEHMKLCDLVITGEGKIDDQTKNGKTPYGVAQLASQYCIPAIAIAGALDISEENIRECGFSAVMSIIEKPVTLEEAIKNTPDLIQKAAIRILSLIKTGKKI